LRTAAVNEVVRQIEDVSGRVLVLRVKHKVGNTTRQTLLLTNISGQPIDGPLYLVVDGLTEAVRLNNASGFTQAHVRPGDPFLFLPLDQLAAGQSFMLDLLFSNPRDLTPYFNTFVLAGPGVV